MDVRRKGHTLELDEVHYWQSLNYDACTSRQCNRDADNKKIDLVKIPIAIQCKNGYATGFNYERELASMKQSNKKGEFKDHPFIVRHKKPKFDCYAMDIKVFNYFVETASIKTKTSLSNLMHTLILSADRFEKQKTLILIDVKAMRTIFNSVYKLPKTND